MLPIDGLLRLKKKTLVFDDRCLRCSFRTRQDGDLISCEKKSVSASELFETDHFYHLASVFVGILSGASQSSSIKMWYRFKFCQKKREGERLSQNFP
jgi:hypothetical protein